MDFSVIIGPVFEVIKRLIPDPAKQAEIQAEVTKAILANQAAVLDAAKSVMVADAQSEGWLTRNARPITVVWGLTMITWLGVIAPALGIAEGAIKAIQAVPSDLWSLVTVGIGAYMLGKTAEHAVKSYASRPR